MSVEKDKVLTAIEAKFKGKSISKTFKENIAAKWAEKIDNETDIDSYIDDREDVILEAAREADTRVTDAVKKALANKADDKKNDDKKDDIELPDDTPAWAKAIVDQNKALAAKVEIFEAQQKTKTIQERWENHPDLKNIPAFVKKLAMPKSEDDFDTALETLKTEYSAIEGTVRQDYFNSDVPGSSTPIIPSANKGKVDPDLVNYAKSANKTEKV